MGVHSIPVGGWWRRWRRRRQRCCLARTSWCKQRRPGCWVGGPGSCLLRSGLPTSTRSCQVHCLICHVIQNGSIRSVRTRLYLHCTCKFHCAQHILPSSLVFKSYPHRPFRSTTPSLGFSLQLYRPIAVLARMDFGCLGVRGRR